MLSQTAVESEDAASFKFWLRFWRWAIVGEQILGGLFGLYVVSSQWAVTTNRPVFLVGVVFFFVSICAGILLAFNKPIGVIISLVVQGMQLVQISTAGLLFFVTCGARLLLGFYQDDSGTVFGFSADLKSAFIFLPNPPALPLPQLNDIGIGSSGSSEVATGINLAALSAIICLLYVRAAYRKSATRNIVSLPKG